MKSRQQQAKKKGILSTAISGVKKFAGGIWSGVKSLFTGKGSGLSNPQPEPYDISKPVSSYTSIEDIRIDYGYDTECLSEKILSIEFIDGETSKSYIGSLFVTNSDLILNLPFSFSILKAILQV